MAARIVVAEDNVQSLELMCYILTKAGHAPVPAHDGAQAIEAARREHPDLILMDVQMPVMDGFEAARVLKRDPGLRKVPLVAVTAFAMVGDRERVLASGYDGYIAKPIAPENFVQLVDAFLDEDKRSEWSSQPDVAPRPKVVAAVERSPERRVFKERTVEGALRVLVVDNEETNRAIMRTTLEAWGFEVITATGPEGALAVALRSVPDLIITDINMPGYSGYDLIRAVKSHADLGEVTVIVVTSSVWDDRDREKAMSLGAARFIRRPITPETFLVEIRKALAEAGKGDRWRAS
jgi:CheY-like chemotaxis protein